MPTLEWIGKRAVLNHHREVPYHLLKADPSLSVGEPGSGNLIVQGDNLLALKALLPYYAGKVKCIYIDPPYNTGNENWTYNDAVNSPEMRAWLGKVVGREAEDLSRHDKWLCMMYPRLSLLRQFLSPDGVIFVSIDDNETGRLRLLMDEVFGPRAFVACNVWQKRYSRENRGSIGDAHEYVMAYAPNPDLFKQTVRKLPFSEKQAKVYKKSKGSASDRRWRAIPMTAQGYRPNQMYKITLPSGRVIEPPEGRCWSMIECEFQELRSVGRIYFGKKGDSQPGVIRFLDEVDGITPWTWWNHEDFGHTDEAKKEIQRLFGTQTAFDTPKPLRLIQRILQIATGPDDLVLDSFGGSGTTGHAVLAQNKADGGRRNFILVEMDAQICRTVTSARLSKAVQGYECVSASKGKTTVDGLGGGFAFCSLGIAMFDEHGTIRSEVIFDELARHIWFSETGTPMAKAKLNSSLVGIEGGTAYYLLFNGILGDKRPNGGNVLTARTLEHLAAHNGPKVIFGEGCKLGASRLRREQITFKQIPYQLRTL
jgi:site-specific DNA-methyltransferase (adenine-specific)/adenine-specific DNA-methyltransferase